MGRTILFEATQELMKEDGLTKLKEAYGGHLGKVRDLNDAIMVVLQKKRGNWRGRGKAILRCKRNQAAFHS